MCWATSRPAARSARRPRLSELAPYIEKALARKEWMRPLERHEVPVVEASVVQAGVPTSTIS